MSKKNICIIVGLIVCLSPLNSPAQAIDKAKAIGFIKSCQNTAERAPNLRGIYWNVLLSEALQEQVDTTKFVNSVYFCLNQDGGYGLWPGDISTSEATFQALVVFNKLGAAPQSLNKTIQFLKAQLPPIETKIEEVSFVGYEEQLYQILIALHLIAEKPEDIERLVCLLGQDSEPRSLFYYIDACTKFGVLIKNSPQIIEILDNKSVSKLIDWGGWDLTGKHYAVEIMHRLGGKFEYEFWIKNIGNWIRWKVEEEGKDFLGKLEGAYHASMLIKLLNLDKSLLEPFRQYLQPESELQGGFGSLPGYPADPIATLHALKTLSTVGEPVEMPAYASYLQSKQKAEGYFELSEIPGWWNEGSKRSIRIDHTWKALSILDVLGEKIDKADTCATWISDILEEKTDDLESMEIYKLLESLSILNQKPTGSDKLFAYLESQQNGDPYYLLRCYEILGQSPTDVETLRKRVVSWLDRSQDKELKLGLGLICRKFQALDILGVKYHNIEVYRVFLNNLQNPDGGFHKPLDVHSNLFDTCFALDLARILQRIK